MKNQKRMAARRRVLVRSVVAGLGSMLTISTPQAGHYTAHSSAQTALRGDMARLGGDMNVAIERVRRREEASK